MPKGILLGIDLGTTVLKVCAFDARRGGLLAQASERLPVSARPGGGREQSPAAIDRTFRRAICAVRQAVGSRWAAVEGIGLAAQGGSSIIADRATGRSRTPMVLWNDGRTARYASEIAATKSLAYWREHLLSDVPPAGLGRLRWLQEKHPNLFSDAHIHIGAGEYLFFALTSAWRQDAGHAFQIGSYSARKMRLDRDPFDISGLPLSFVAPLRQGHETAPLAKRAARSFDLREGIPVAGPYIDQEAGYMAVMKTSDSPLQCSLGTAWVGNFALPEGVAGHATLQLPIPSPSGKGRLVILPILAGNLTWDWALARFVDPDPAKALPRAEASFAKSLLPPPGLVAFPWFTLPNPCHPASTGAGGVMGLNSATRQEDLLRAVAAGLVFEFVRMFHHVRDSGIVDAVILGGGASNGAHFRRLLAALFAPLPVFWQRDADLAAARGALYAFRDHFGCAPLLCVSTPGRRARQQIEAGYDIYRAAWESLPAIRPGGEAWRPCSKGK